ncbi:hypothetical protein ABEH87_01790 [Erwinia sp. Eh17-17]|uniref:hypothetical protein n=1 Tax=Erwinia sp. Eh17-17 TaxID=3080330 RepID=UPI003207E02B
MTGQLSGGMIRAIFMFLFIFIPNLVFATPYSNWANLIQNISSGDQHTLEELSETVIRINHSFSDSQSIEFVEAIGFALIKNPLTTLNSTNKLVNNKDVLVQRYDTGTVCSLPLIMEYSKKSTLLYYKLASESLKKAGLPARECLKNMQASFEEVESEEERGTMKWGEKEFTP